MSGYVFSGSTSEVSTYGTNAAGKHVEAGYDTFGDRFVFDNVYFCDEGGLDGYLFELHALEKEGALAAG